MKIGVTGHQERAGIDWPWTRSAILRYLAGKPLLKGYSSLAVGSDQIFAECILQCEGKLIAVIPTPDYEKHFDETGFESYRHLIASAEVIELASTKPDDVAFLDAGKWVAREVDRLVAVWDGGPAEGLGGTADIVAYARTLGRPVHHIDPIRRIVADF